MRDQSTDHSTGLSFLLARLANHLRLSDGNRSFSGHTRSRRVALGCRHDPVAGSVVESGDEACCDKPSTYYNIEFRDGITVQINGDSMLCLEGQRSIKQQEVDRMAPVSRYRFVVRIPPLSLTDYQLATDKLIARTQPKNLAWAQLNQLPHLTASDCGSNSLLNILVGNPCSSPEHKN